MAIGLDLGMSKGLYLVGRRDKKVIASTESGDQGLSKPNLDCQNDRLTFNLSALLAVLSQCTRIGNEFF